MGSVYALFSSLRVNYYCAYFSLIYASTQLKHNKTFLMSSSQPNMLSACHFQFVSLMTKNCNRLVLNSFKLNSKRIPQNLSEISHSPNIHYTDLNGQYFTLITITNGQRNCFQAVIKRKCCTRDIWAKIF